MKALTERFRLTPVLGVVWMVFALASPLLPLDGLRTLALLLLVAGAAMAGRPPLHEARGLLQAARGWLPWVVWAAASVLWSLDRDYSAYFWSSEVLAAVLCFLAGWQLGRTVISLQLVWLALAAMVLAQGVATAAHLFLPAQVPLYYPGWLDNQPQSGAFLLAGLAAACALLAEQKMRSTLLAVAVMLSMQLVAWVAFKRAPYLGMGVQALLTLALVLPQAASRRLPWRLPIILGLFLVFTVMAALAVGAQRKASFAPGAGDEKGWVASFKQNERKAMWRFWWESGSNNQWLGVGVGRYLPNKAYIDPRTSTVDPWLAGHAHNVFVNQWLQLGMFGLIAWLWLWIWLFRQVGGVGGAVNCQQVLLLRRLVPPLLAGMLVCNLTDDLLYGALGVFWWLLLGIFWSKQRSHL